MSSSSLLELPDSLSISKLHALASHNSANNNCSNVEKDSTLQNSVSERGPTWRSTARGVDGTIPTTRRPNIDLNIPPPNATAGAPNPPPSQDNSTSAVASSYLVNQNSDSSISVSYSDIPSPVHNFHNSRPSFSSRTDSFASLFSSRDQENATAPVSDTKQLDLDDDEDPLNSFDGIFEETLDMLSRSFDFDSADVLMDQYLKQEASVPDTENGKPSAAGPTTKALNPHQLFGFHRNKIKHIDKQVLHSVNVSELLNTKDLDIIAATKAMMTYILQLNFDLIPDMKRPDLVQLYQLTHVMLDMKFHECLLHEKKEKIVVQERKRTRNRMWNRSNLVSNSTRDVSVDAHDYSMVEMCTVGTMTESSRLSNSFSVSDSSTQTEPQQRVSVSEEAIQSCSPTMTNTASQTNDEFTPSSKSLQQKLEQCYQRIHDLESSLKNQEIKHQLSLEHQHTIIKKSDLSLKELKEKHNALQQHFEQERLEHEKLKKLFQRRHELRESFSTMYMLEEEENDDKEVIRRIHPMTPTHSTEHSLPLVRRRHDFPQPISPHKAKRKLTSSFSRGRSSSSKRSLQPSISFASARNKGSTTVKSARMR